jgi:hypothetical protein
VVALLLVLRHAYRFPQSSLFWDIDELAPAAQAVPDEPLLVEPPLDVSDFVQVLHASLSEGRKSRIGGSALVQKNSQPYTCEALARHQVGLPSDKFDVSLCVYDNDCFDAFVHIARRDKRVCNDSDAIFRFVFGILACLWRQCSAQPAETGPVCDLPARGVRRISQDAEFAEFVAKHIGPDQFHLHAIGPELKDGGYDALFDREECAWRLPFQAIYSGAPAIPSHPLPMPCPRCTLYAVQASMTCL